MEQLPQNLTFEQQFAIVSFDNQVDQMSTEQMRVLLKFVHKSYIVQQAHFKELLKHQWGLEDNGANTRPTREERKD